MPIDSRTTGRKFSAISCVDNINLTDDAYWQLAALSDRAFVPIKSDPEDADEVIKRIGDADCALVSWRTRVDDSILAQCSPLKYIGLCASNYSNLAIGNVDVLAAEKRGITVCGVRQYGDEATAEFIFCALLNLCRGFGQAQWKDEPTELYGKRLGIVGLGEMGKHVMRLAMGFGMEVVYFSRTRKSDCEQSGVKFLSKDELLQTSNMVSLHVPRSMPILTGAEFDSMREDAVLINTCLGQVFTPDDFEYWIGQFKRFAIMDESSDVSYRKFRGLPNIVYPLVVAGRTIESRARLSSQVLSNIEAFLSGLPKNTMV